MAIFGSGGVSPSAPVLLRRVPGFAEVDWIRLLFACTSHRRALSCHGLVPFGCRTGSLFYTSLESRIAQPEVSAAKPFQKIPLLLSLLFTHLFFILNIKSVTKTKCVFSFGLSV